MVMFFIAPPTSLLHGVGRVLLFGNAPLFRSSGCSFWIGALFRTRLASERHYTRPGSSHHEEGSDSVCTEPRASVRPTTGDVADASKMDRVVMTMMPLK
jgi:hypothetical protein